MLSFPQTKTDEPRTAVVSEPKAIEGLHRYLRAYPVDASGYLFLAPEGEGPLGYQTLWRRVDRAAERAGFHKWEGRKKGARSGGKKVVRKRIYPYLFRHTWNTIEGARMPHHLRNAQTGTSSETILAHYDHIGAPQLLEWYQEHGEGAPVVPDTATETLKEVRDQLEALSNTDAALAEALKDILGSMPKFKMGRGARNPLADTQTKLRKLIGALEGVDR